jgi:hypothetical protein
MSLKPLKLIKYLLDPSEMEFISYRLDQTWFDDNAEAHQ